VKCAFIAAKMAVFPITVLCRVLDLSRAAFYAWVDRPPSPHTVEDRRLAILVREAFERSRRTYGSPRVHAELAAQGVFVSKKRVARIMRQEGLRARVRRRYKCTTMSEHDQTSPSRPTCSTAGSRLRSPTSAGWGTPARS
jgi:putative transposase